MTRPDDQPEHEDCPRCGRGSCSRFSKCGGPDYHEADWIPEVLKPTWIPTPKAVA